MSYFILCAMLRHLRCRRFNFYSFSHQNMQINYVYNMSFKKMLNTSQYKLIVRVPSSISKSYTTDCDQTKDIKPFDVHIKNLSSYYISSGYVHPDLFKKVINSLNSIKLTEEQSNFVLESINWLYTISTEERLNYFKVVWEYFKTNEYISQEKIIIAFKLFQKNNLPVNEAKVLLDYFNNLKYDLNYYEELVLLACENGDIEKTMTEILEEMQEKKFPLTQKIFNALIIGHSKTGNIKNCETVLDTMNAANLIPSNDTFFELLRAYIENGLESKAETMSNKILDGLSSNQILMLVKAAASVNSRDLAKKFIEKLPKELGNVVDLPINLRRVSIEFLYSNNIDSAFLILDIFPKANFNDNKDKDTLGRFFVNKMIKSGRYTDEKCLEMCFKLINNSINERALHIACEIVLKRYCQKAEIYLEALSNLEKLRPHYFWPLLNYNFKKKGEIGILDTLKIMSTLSTDADYDTLCSQCFPRLSLFFKNVERAAKNLENNGLKPSIFLIPLLSHLIIQKKLNDVIKLNDLYPTKIDTIPLIKPLANLAVNVRVNKLYEQYSKLIKGLIMKRESKNLDLAGQVLIELWSNPQFQEDAVGFFEILKQLEIQDIKISKAAGDVLEQQILKLQPNEKCGKIFQKLKEITSDELKLFEYSDSIVDHPRDMNLEELEHHLVELEEKKMNTRGVLRRLLQLYVREKQLEKALITKQKCDKLNVHYSPGMLASILDLHIKLKHLNDAKNCLQEIKNKYPGFLIDEHKIVDLAALMVENNELEMAQDLILERASTTKITGGEHIYKNLWNLLTQIAHFSARQYPSDSKNLTKDFLDILKKYRFCKPKNVLLGPIIREYLLKKRYKEAVQEFKNIADTFKKTPLQQEIMSILLRIANNKEESDSVNLSQEEAELLLQDVITYSSKVHGSFNCNGTLLLAVAESGNEKQLRKLLIDPTFQFNTDLLCKNIEYLNTNGRIENIIKLAKASRGVRHSLNEEELYKMLLNEFIKNNNFESAINLFNKLEAEDDFKLSGDFMKGLVNLLKLNKVDIPSNVALRAQFKI